MRIDKPKRKKATTKAAHLVQPPTKTAGSKKASSNSKDTARLNVNVPREMYRQLRIKAAEKETSVSKAVIGLIENYVAKR